MLVLGPNVAQRNVFHRQMVINLLIFHLRFHHYFPIKLSILDSNRIFVELNQILNWCWCRFVSDSFTNWKRTSIIQMALRYGFNVNATSTNARHKSKTNANAQFITDGYAILIFYTKLKKSWTNYVFNSWILI